MARRYQFNFPVTVSAFNSLLFPAILKEYQVWNTLPEQLKNKLLHNNTKGLRITRKDLDNIGDKEYSKVKPLLQLYA